MEGGSLGDMLLVAPAFSLLPVCHKMSNVCHTFPPPHVSPHVDPRVGHDKETMSQSKQFRLFANIVWVTRPSTDRLAGKGQG